MKNKYLFVLLMLICIALGGLGLTGVYVSRQDQRDQEQNLTVVTSFYPMYIAAMNVIGDTPGVTLENLSEPQTGCLHDYQLTPEDMKLLSTADVFIVNGGGIETFLTDVAKSYPDLQIIYGGENVEMLDDNAHVWMNMEDYKIQVETIANKLAEADSAHASQYAANAEAYCGRIQVLCNRARALREQIQGEPVVIFHEAYAYVAQEYGLEVVGSMDLDEERQVSAGEVAEILNVIEEYHVPVVLAEQLYGESMGNTVEGESDAQVVYLDPLTRGNYEKDSYLDAMENNMEQLEKAFEQHSHEGHDHG
ncbi:MAG TPA: metal ABC transporter substrate-binding protein [Candidatus Eubacterium avistercoris]|uniref:Metal ABC transporter substrate-binding protein n=1 Tax=Candidatus Eubacterium avistercoris TaxID=2838567 RepID=A0A9D2D1X2_9FIRM|nr:metal ABC transporter substrate-binding protein [Candidatus Eubacterium avistercoris]